MNQPQPISDEGMRCWCGSQKLRHFSPDYAECESCGTLVRRNPPTEDLTAVTDAANDLYGRNYYEKHLVADLHQPQINERMRTDLIERCLHWLRTVQDYTPRGGKILEIGCGHGGSVALFDAAGFKTTGLELSPWLVDLAKRSWQIDVRVGPIEAQDFAPGTFDTIALFDVLEHLQHPKETLAKCRELLSPHGVLIIQTPEHVRGRSYEEMLRTEHPFLSLLIPEHLYLYTRDAARRLMSEVGVGNVVHEPAMFSHYDQFFVAGHAVPQKHDIRDDPHTNATTSMRLVQGLIDLDAQRRQLAARLAEVEPFESEVRRLNARLAELNAELDHANAMAASERREQELSLSARLHDVRTLTATVADRNARIEQLAQQLEAANETAKSQLVEKEQRLVAAIDEGHALRGQVDRLLPLLQSEQANSSARQEQIVQLTNWLNTSRADCTLLRAQVEKLTASHNSLESESNNRFRQIESLTAMVHSVEAESLARYEQIQTLTKWVSELQRSKTSA